MEDRYTLRGMLEEKKEDMQALLTRMDNCVKDILYRLKLTDRAYLSQIGAFSGLIGKLRQMDMERAYIEGQIKDLEHKLKTI